jgi:hypothetical protein
VIFCPQCGSPAEWLTGRVAESTVIVSIASAEQTALDQRLVDALAQCLGHPLTVRLRAVFE